MNNVSHLRHSYVDELIEIQGLEETLRQIGDYLYEIEKSKENTQRQREEARWNRLTISEAIDDLYHNYPNIESRNAISQPKAQISQGL